MIDHPCADCGLTRTTWSPLFLLYLCTACLKKRTEKELDRPWKRK